MDDTSSPANGKQAAAPHQPRANGSRAQNFDWDAATKNILSQLDIAAEYRAMGVTIAGHKAAENGWLACHAIDRPDNNPSAAINVISGRYLDSASGDEKSQSLWDFAAQRGSFPDWLAALKHFADKTGVVLPGSGHKSLRSRPPKDPDDLVDWTPWNEDLANYWCFQKPGVTVEALKLANCRMGRYPKKTGRFSVLAAPIYGDKLVDDKPISYVLWNLSPGGMLEVRGKGGALRTVKMKTLEGTSAGLMNYHGLFRLVAGNPELIVWKVEGPTDAMALQRIIPPDQRDRHLVVTNSGGSKQSITDKTAKLFAGISVFVLHDADEPGEAGAAKWCRSLHGVAAVVKHVKLPYSIEPKHGKDLRDWINEGHTFGDLLVLASEAGEFKPSMESEGGTGRHKKSLPNDAIVNGIQLEGDDGPIIVALPISEIIDDTLKKTESWPRRAGNALFVDDPAIGICHFQKHSELFGWIHRRVGRVNWHKALGCVTRDEFFAELQRTAQSYRAVEDYPHFPSFSQHYYAHNEVRPGDGAALQGLLDLFCPETPIDRDLILAMFATALWGGEGGTRPAFVIVSDAGRGVGKSKLVELLGRLLGGMFAVSKDDKAADIIKRLLTAEAATKRIVLIDNVKSNRLSWADLESLITCPAISGHKLYAGERTRPNTLLWAITVNGPSLSRDLAQRSVVIKLAKPQHSGEWEDNARAYVDSRRWEIIADVAAFFQHPSDRLVKNTRWGTWEKEILSRLPEPSDAQRVIAERQDAINADDEEMRDVEEYFEQRLSKLGYSPDIDAVHIPGDITARWFNEATHSNQGRISAIRAMKQAASEGLLKRLRYNTSKHKGVPRGMVWCANNPGTAIQYDIEQTIENSRLTANGADYWDR